MPPSADDDYDHVDRRPGGRNHRTTPPAKFDLRLNPPYQIDFANVAAGKTIAATKRRVRFRFGFSNLQALQEGKVGTDCRGEEHEVVIVISALSGKRQVYSDGHEVHFSYGNRTDSTFETSWTMKGGHLVKIRGHVALPLFETPGFRQFDLTIDGLSYFNMPRLFELGVKTPTGGGAPPRAPLPRSVSPSYDDEQRYYEPQGSSNDHEYGRRRSTPDRRPDENQRSSSMSTSSSDKPSKKTSDDTPKDAGVVDILSDMSISSSSDLLSAEPAGLLLTDGSSSSTFAPPSSHDQFAPVEATAPPAPTNNFASVSQSILSQYGGNNGSAPSPAAAYAPSPSVNGGSSVLALANESHTYYAPPPPTPTHVYPTQPPHGYAAAPPPTQPTSSYYGAPPGGAAYNSSGAYGQPPQQSFYASTSTTTAPASYNNSSTYYAPVSPEGSVRSVTTMDEGSSHNGVYDPSPIKLSMQPLALEDMQEAEALAEIVGSDATSGPRRPLTDVDIAMASLVNLGDITENKVTPEQRKAMQVQQVKQQGKKKSQPAPPAAASWRMGTNATLGDLKSTPKDIKTTSTGPKKEIMRTHAFDPNAVHAGMMVVYGSSEAGIGGGISAPQGFGAARPATTYAPNPYYQHQHQQQFQQQQQPYGQPSYAAAPVQTGY